MEQRDYWLDEEGNGHEIVEIEFGEQLRKTGETMRRVGTGMSLAEGIEYLRESIDNFMAYDEDEPVYSHRNGETEPPTESGYFWCNGIVKIPTGEYEMMCTLYVAPWLNGAMLTKVDGHLVSIHKQAMVYPLGEWNCKWWGPVTPPWRENV